MLYIIGGRNNTPAGNIDTVSVDRYDPLRDEWKPMPLLSVPRNRLGVAVVDDGIYAIGGGNGNTCHTSEEKYDARQDEWTTVISLNFPRIGRFWAKLYIKTPLQAGTARVTSWQEEKILLLKFVEKVTNLATCLHTTLSEFHFNFFLVTVYLVITFLLLLVCRLATLNKIKKGDLLKKCCNGFSAIFLLNSVTILLKFSYSQSFPLRGQVFELLFVQ